MNAWHRGARSREKKRKKKKKKTRFYFAGVVGDVIMFNKYAKVKTNN